GARCRLSSFFSSRRRHTRSKRDWSSDVCSSDLVFSAVLTPQQFHETQAHFDFFRKHFATKGIEVATACAETLLSLERLRSQVAEIGRASCRDRGERPGGGRAGSGERAGAHAD